MIVYSKASVKGMLGDTTSSRTDAYSASSSYSTSSDNTVGHLAAYADELSSYNYHYVQNKTKVMTVSIYFLYFSSILL